MSLFTHKHDAPRPMAAHADAAQGLADKPAVQHIPVEDLADDVLDLIDQSYPALTWADVDKALQLASAKNRQHYAAHGSRIPPEPEEKRPGEEL